MGRSTSKFKIIGCMNFESLDPESKIKVGFSSLMITFRVFELEKDLFQYSLI